MQMITVATKLDWSGWLRGAIGALISGGASSISAGFGATILDPMHDINIFHLMGLTFVSSGIVSLAKFLQTEPTPSPK